MVEITLSEGNTAPLEEAAKSEMEKAIKHFEHELVGIRTGRAHTSMVDNIKVSCYDGQSEMPLRNLATITTPDPRLIMIQPWDQATLADIQRALSSSDLGIVPVVDGNIIRIQLQEMSSARREELKKILQKKLEECRIAIRGARKQLHNLIRDTQKAKDISEDFAKRLDDCLQKKTDTFIKQAESMSAKKEMGLSQ